MNTAPFNRILALPADRRLKILESYLQIDEIAECDYDTVDEISELEYQKIVDEDLKYVYQDMLEEVIG